MSRQKYQRPTVYPMGKREKLWKGEWREYFIGSDGRQQSRHKSKTWSRTNYTKAAAQAELDALLRQQEAGGAKRDGRMSLAAFWDEIYFPIHVGQWGLNSRNQIGYLWRKHIAPALGAKPLLEITKADIALHLVKLANAKLGRDLIDGIRKRIHAVLEEAVDNEFIPRNPCRKVELPRCKAKPETRSMTVEEIQRLWDGTTGMDYVFWRLLILTGIRIGEALALTRYDLLPTGLLIDESALRGRPSTTKSKKTRLVPLADELREELQSWLATHCHALIFPTVTGKMHERNDPTMTEVRDRGRMAAGIPDLTPKMCRTTFSTLIDGDVADTQAMLGHHSSRVTLEFYKKAIPVRQQEAVNQLDSKLRVMPKREGVA